MKHVLEHVTSLFSLNPFSFRRTGWLQIAQGLVRSGPAVATFALLLVVSCRSARPYTPFDQAHFIKVCRAIWQEELGRPIDPIGLEGCLDQARSGRIAEQIRADVQNSSEWIARHAEPPPAPDVPPTPTPLPITRPVYPEHRMNFLTAVLASGKAEHQNIDVAERYQHRSEGDRRAVREAHVQDGMTRYYLDTVKDDADEFAQPDRLVPFLKELESVGLGPVAGIAPEDAPRMQAKYSPVSKFIAAMERALRVWKPYLSEVQIGVEASETWPRPSDILAIAKAARAVLGPKIPITLHLNSGQVRPKGADSSFWKQAKAAGITHLDYQAHHASVEDVGQGFLANPDAIRDELRAAIKAVGGYAKVRSNEYAYFGTRPSSTVIREIRARGFELGDKSLEVEGVAGIGNGGPGYWPEEASAPPPVGTTDDIDIKKCRFFTRTNAEITSQIQSWPIQSKLSPRFSGSQVFYKHTATNSWPVKGTVNANSWVCFDRDGLRCYTNDYLHRGQAEKRWKGKLDTITEDPPINWKAKRGDTLYLMVSRLARLGTYPTGKGRSNLVRVTAP